MFPLVLLMALAYALVTRYDVAIDLVALQRIARTPTYGHIRKLNTIAKWTQKHPLRLGHRKLECQRIVEGHTAQTSPGPAGNWRWWTLAASGTRCNFAL